MELDTPEFTSKDDEIQYWMEVAQQMYQRKEEVEHELEEFQENSQMLEKELETSLEQSEKTNRELRQRNSRLSTEMEQLRSRLNQQTSDCSVFQSRATELESQHDQLVKYIRELEQKNDDLERAQRINTATEEAIEAKFNSAIEKNALLESELDEKESLKVIVQRLMDENRDLKQEINILKRYVPDNDKSADKVRSLVDSNKLQVELETNVNSIITPMTNQNITNGQQQQQVKIGNGVVGGVNNNNNNNNNINNNNNNNMNMPMAPSTRILAMNMIGDLMRKVGALENKLNTCRNASREDQSMRDLYREKKKRLIRRKQAIHDNKNRIKNGNNNL
ncbi:nuclear distribution protein nudE-like 1-A isoform X1 [Aphidius gifuensis]|uniref:nuclear distribution protein nudE-like 1-A isoform X1 n=1 Tax=Aphidius gifuensis TaxID=684658 RepID=UPI001CDB86D0|nr:nuclear distribution protein nudE-like 1-A isoform X1 [Aphidius gifuensis]XP_044008890.1 nuclear distribution protein nudE-like 1-A isoform X1 [Aphidius gifuensis]